MMGMSQKQGRHGGWRKDELGVGGPGSGVERVQRSPEARPVM